jgi:hypothetical protein
VGKAIVELASESSHDHGAYLLTPAGLGPVR